MSKTLLPEDKIKELAKTVSADETSFVNYFKIFQNLYNAVKSTSFTNYFHKVSLFDLENVNKIKNEDSFLKAIATFINEVTYNKTKLHFHISNEESIQKVIKVLKMLKTPKKYKYYISIAQSKNKEENSQLNIFAKNKELFEYIDTIDDNRLFDDFTKKVIEEQIDVAKIFYVDLDKIEIDKVIEYSTKYPNRIKELYAFENKEFDKIKKLCDLNAESLIRTPNCRIDLYPNLKNIKIITINSETVPNPLPENFNYDSVKELETYMLEDDSIESADKALELINKCKNVEIVALSMGCDLTQEQFLHIFTKTTSKNIRQIHASCQEFEDDADLTPVFTNLPKLSVFDLEFHCSMDFAYSLLPCITCEKFALPFPLLEQLLNNYIKEDEDNYISGNFSSDFQDFYDYFKDKKEIMMRIQRMTGDDCQNQEIPYLNELTVSNPEEIDSFNVKQIGTLIINCPLDDKLKQFVEKTNPSFLRIKNGKIEKNNIKIIYNLENEEIIY